VKVICEVVARVIFLVLLPCKKKISKAMTMRLREWSAARVSLIAGKLYPMHLKTSTNFPGPLRFWHTCGKPRARRRLSANGWAIVMLT